jgi:hypothetical protein
LEPPKRVFDGVEVWASWRPLLKAESSKWLPTKHLRCFSAMKRRIILKKHQSLHWNAWNAVCGGMATLKNAAKVASGMGKKSVDVCECVPIFILLFETKPNTIFLDDGCVPLLSTKASMGRIESEQKTLWKNMIVSLDQGENGRDVLMQQLLDEN